MHHCLCAHYNCVLGNRAHYCNNCVLGMPPLYSCVHHCMCALVYNCVLCNMPPVYTCVHVQLWTSPLHVCTLQLCTATRGKLQCSPNLTVAHPALSLLCSLNCPHITPLSSSLSSSVIFNVMFFELPSNCISSSSSASLSRKHCQRKIRFFKLQLTFFQATRGNGHWTDDVNSAMQCIAYSGDWKVYQKYGLGTWPVIMVGEGEKFRSSKRKGEWLELAGTDEGNLSQAWALEPGK